MNSHEFNLFLGDKWDYYMFLAEGLSGGLVACWRSDIASFNVKEANSQVVNGELNIANKGIWNIATIYGNKNCFIRRNLWSCMEAIANLKLLAIIGGDFNCLLTQEDKKGENKFVFSTGAQDMYSFMSNCDFNEVSIVGPKYTWCNNKEGKARILERLDRCIINSATLKTIKVAAVKHLARLASDHCPILLKIFSSGFGRNKTIMYEEVWATFPASYVIISRSWKKPMRGSNVEILNAKFKRSLKALFFWSRAKHKSLEELKKSLKDEILELQMEESADGGLSENKLQILRSKVCQLNSTIGRICTWWRQRAKIQWIKDGDSNSKFFHAYASARKNSNWIKQIKNDDGGNLEDQMQIENYLC
ncbi:hypothetical protein KFK09_017695 [Dendrobium nobile]|uniref:Uncharacterized protein n=1 Tax=Dendrobium nobile TaxID=94219 RepID=A0A8T3ATP6_DENNO|nr:hypothetical protein KFK09_017695 [Dendrobium nobile]